MATAPIGHNNPPPLTPFEAIKAHVDDLEAEALNHLDGKAIETQAQADAVSKLLEQAREALKAADERRKLEAKPFDDGKAAVQALWKPITDEKTGRCAIIARTCKSALSAFLSLEAERQRAVAQALQEEANRQAEAAAQAARSARPDDLAGQTTARVLQENAVATQKAADRAAKAPVQAKGGERATSLRKATFRAEITDPLEFGKWAWVNRRGEYLTFLDTLAQLEAKQPRPIPGITFHENERKAV